MKQSVPKRGKDREQCTSKKEYKNKNNQTSFIVAWTKSSCVISTEYSYINAIVFRNDKTAR